MCTKSEIKHVSSFTWFNRTNHHASILHYSPSNKYTIGNRNKFIVMQKQLNYSRWMDGWWIIECVISAAFPIWHLNTHQTTNQSNPYSTDPFAGPEECVQFSPCCGFLFSLWNCVTSLTRFSSTAHTHTTQSRSVLLLPVNHIVCRSNSGDTARLGLA